MQIRVMRDLLSGSIEVPAGEYLVALRADSQQIRLTGKGMDLLLPAVRRRNMGRGKIETISFSSGGGGVWSVVVSHPKLGEWAALLEEKARAGGG